MLYSIGSYLRLFPTICAAIYAWIVLFLQTSLVGSVVRSLDS